MDSLRRFLNNKEHFSRNIASIEFGSVANDCADGCGTFEHSLQVNIAEETYGKVQSLHL